MMKQQQMIGTRMHRWLLVLLALVAPHGIAHAHVKWFSEFNYADPPRTLGEIVSPLFVGLAVLSMAVIGALVFVDRWMQARPWWQHVQNWLADRKEYSTLVVRIATGVTLLLAWQADAMLVPELGIDAPWVGWYQFLLAVLLVFPRTTPLAGVGLALLYVYGGLRFGAFYMLDYAHFIGIAAYLTLSNVRSLRLRALRLPVLYATVGFSLFWLGLEKLVYPEWGLYLLEQNPQLALGFPPQFFLTGAAFVELSLGYLLIIGLFERPLALTITLVFFTTTLVFGKVEVIGHTTLHAALIVFLLHGPGTVYRAPVTFHRRLPLRVAFAAVNFALVVAILLPVYQAGAWYQHRNYTDQQAADAQHTDETAADHTHAPGTPTHTH
jgi:uncharacterized membrane protein YphA (DoxX/SURF4 family)